MINFFFLISIFTEASDDSKQREFRLMQLQQDSASLFALVTQFLNAKEFLLLALGSTELNNTLTGSLKNLKMYLNAEFGMNFRKYFVTPPIFPLKEFVLPYFHFFCFYFGTETTPLEQGWKRDDSNPQKIIKFFTRLKNNKLQTEKCMILEGGKIKLLHAWDDDSFRSYQVRDNTLPLVLAKDGVLRNAHNCKPEVQKVGTEFVMSFTIPPEFSVVSYLTPENFHAHIRRFPFAKFPGFK